VRLGALRHPWVALAFRLALGAVFLWAGIGKAMSPHEFGLEIARYRMVPQEAINLMAILLPWIEILAGVGLVVGAWARASALVCGALMVVFIVAIVSALRRGLDISCGCFGGGADSSKMSQATLWRDLVWLVWAVHVFFYDRGVLGIDRLLARRRARLAVAAAGTAAPPKGGAA
jgi:uncharacterized membrane protein YphA (DoxX/SURF4 family)